MLTLNMLLNCLHLGKVDLIQQLDSETNNICSLLPISTDNVDTYTCKYNMDSKAIGLMHIFTDFSDLINESSC